jgi:acetyl esterase
MSSAIAGRPPGAAGLAPELHALLERLAAQAPPVTATIEQVREHHAGVHVWAFAESGLTTPAVADVAERWIAVEGGEIRARIFTPLGSGPWPAYVHLHGGRWTVGSIDWPTVRYTSAEVCARVGCVVVDVEYRLAPEHRFPRGAEDCYAALAWTVEHAEEIAVDASRIAVAGESAGGNLAAAVCLMARDRGGPEIALQLLEIPALDLADMNGYSSAEAFGQGYGLDSSFAEIVSRSYFDDPAQARHPYASPILAEDLSGLPPAFVMTAELDLLRDGGEAYAARLAQAGVPTTLVREPGHTHASPIFLMRWAPTLRWREQRLKALRSAFTPTTESP